MSTIGRPRSTRRTFLKHVGFAGATLPLVMPALARAASPNGKLNMAAVGVSGKGWSDLNNTTEGEHVAAICDIDANHLARAREAFPDAQPYADFREMFEKHEIDACTVTTPDHMHAFVSMWAMQRGTAVYTQKPLTHSIHEARALAKVAAEKNVVTQMGIQGHSRIGTRMIVHYLRENVIGPIKHVHVWTDRPHGWWPQPVERPSHSDPVPDAINWDVWLGVAEERPFVRDVYHPFRWRGWVDFGTGAIGDIGCHRLDPIVEGLDLRPARRVRHEGPATSDESFPEWSILHYEFAGTRHTVDPLPITWYDGGKKPPKSITDPLGQRMGDNGVLCIGEEGVLLSTNGDAPQLLPRERFREVERPDLEPRNHYTQWRDAARGEDEASAPFSFAAPLTETCLVGAIATRFPDQTLEWNEAEMKFTNHDEANAFVRRTYREGWEVEGL